MKANLTSLCAYIPILRTKFSQGGGYDEDIQPNQPDGEAQDDDPYLLHQLTHELPQLLAQSLAQRTIQAYTNTFEEDYHNGSSYDYSRRYPKIQTKPKPPKKTIIQDHSIQRSNFEPTMESMKTDMFYHLQTRIWRPGEFLYHLETLINPTKSHDSHWIRRIQSCSHFPYLESFAFKLQRLLPYMLSHEFDSFPTLQKVPRHQTYMPKLSRYKKRIRISISSLKSPSKLQRL